MSDELPMLHVRLAMIDDEGEPSGWCDIRIPPGMLDRIIDPEEVWRRHCDLLARMMWREHISPMLAVDGSAAPS